MRTWHHVATYVVSFFEDFVWCIIHTSWYQTREYVAALDGAVADLEME